ncbi:MAG: FAD-binding oxidoreductase, partial [Betaproteobacteria bacterium]
MQNTFIDALRAALGPAQVLTEAADTAPYFGDWRKQFRAEAECVVRPADTAQVAAVMRLCAAAGVAVVPQGGNTGLCGGSVPTGSVREIVLSLSRLNRIRRVDPLDNTITVEAGCVLATIQAEAAKADRFFPLSLAAEGSCQIGGNLSTNAGGVNVLRFGNARDQVLGLEVVLPDGRVWNGLRSLRKDNTGYDLKQLFIGSEGTLGVVTRAVLRLRSAPTSQNTAYVATETFDQIPRLLRALDRGLGGGLSAFEVMWPAFYDLVTTPPAQGSPPLARGYPFYI